MTVTIANVYKTRKFTAIYSLKYFINLYLDLQDKRYLYMATETVEAVELEAVVKEKNLETDKDENEIHTEKQKPPPLDISAAQELQQQQSSNGPKTPTSGVPQTPGMSGGTRKDKEKKIGHRRVDDEGQITYKKIQTSQIMGSIQMGIGYAVGSLASKPERDLLMQDFAMVETTIFPSEGSNITPAHHYSDFRFKTYSPVAFRYFRDLFGIQPDDFLLSVCNEPMRELTNPGASGSIFYLTNDDEFIIKTVQHKEAEFLQKLLPGYYMNLNQNPRTLLPKFYGLFNYQCGGKNVRLVAMNNLLPSSIKMHQKYDLKGSTFKRRANKHERSKESPTFKDLDFSEHHSEGILLEAETYSALMKTIQRDCRVLESFKIMDYSLLVGIHNLDQAAREKVEQRIRKELQENQKALMCEIDGSTKGAGTQGKYYGTSLTRSKSINRQRLAAFSTAMESIQAEVEPVDQDEDVPAGGIPARNSKGERLLLFLGIIDILQSYRLKKKLEHTFKSMLHDGDTVSVHRPSFYAQRFQDFMGKTVFKKIPSPLKHSPSKRKGASIKLRPPSGETEGLKTVTECDSGRGETDEPVSLEQSSTDSLTTIPTISPSVVRHIEAQMQKPGSNTDPAYGNKVVSQRSIVSAAKSSFGSLDRSDVVSISQVTIQTESVGSVMSETSSSSTSGLGSTIRTVTWTPPHSVEGSTPTHTEGTPSFTESSSSGDVGCPTTPVKMHKELIRESNVYHETEMTRL